MIQENDLIMLKRLFDDIFLQEKQLVAIRQFTMINNQCSVLCTQAAGESQCYAFWAFLLAPSQAPLTL